MLLGLVPNFERNSFDGANLLPEWSICIVQYSFSFIVLLMNINCVPKYIP